MRAEPPSFPPPDTRYLQHQKLDTLCVVGAPLTLSIVDMSLYNTTQCVLPCPSCPPYVHTVAAFR